MTYLVTQTFILLLIAALLGLVLGWYLTKITAATLRAALQGRLHNLERDATKLRKELDAASGRVAQLEKDCKTAHDENASLRSQLEAAAGSDPTSAQGAERIAALEGELAECREALARVPDDAVAEPAPAMRATGGAVAGDGDEIPSVSRAAAAAAAAARMPGGERAEPGPAKGGTPDDLQQIKGIGPKIAETLRELGIHSFEQIAEWTPEKVNWINDHLKFKGRVEREEWIPQAKALVKERKLKG
jgi:predicted flap endonuclease-1-like 5' DNA nuclease